MSQKTNPDENLSAKMSVADELELVQQETDMSDNQQDADRSPHRDRKQTERGIQFHADRLKQHFRNAVTSWRRQANCVDRLITDEVSIAELREQRDKLDDNMNRLTDLREEILQYFALTPTQIEVYDTTETEHRNLMRTIRDEITEAKSEMSENQSRASSYRSGKSRQTTPASNHGSPNTTTVPQISLASDMPHSLPNAVPSFNTPSAPQFSTAPYVPPSIPNEVDTFNGPHVHSFPMAPYMPPNLPRPVSVPRVQYPPASYMPPSMPNTVPLVGNPPIPQGPAALYVPDTVPNAAPPVNTSPGPPIPTNRQISGDPQTPPNTANEMFMREFLEHLVKQQTEALGYLTLPKSDIPTYDGDPMEYTSFIHAFQSVIENKTTDPSQRLYFLIQYTKGDVKTLMKSCESLDALNGYATARELLRKTYGQPHKIATACINKATTGHEIKSEDSKSLHEYAVTLTSCQIILKEIGYLDRIEVPDNLKKIISRLPFDSRKRWRSKADHITEEQNREISYEDVVKFITHEARILRHSVFGEIQTNKPRQDKDPKKPNQQRSRGSFLTQASEAEKPSTAISKSDGPAQQREKVYLCYQCQGEHKLEDCPKFKAEPYNDRRELVMKKGLCFNCLFPKHRIRDCRRRPSCNECPKKHCTLLHPPEPAAEVPTKVNGFVDLNNRQIALPILPVKVRARGREATVTTYAFLDTGSTSTFCTESLLRKLGVEGKKTQIRLTTMEKSNSDTTTELVNLEILDLDEDLMFELPSVFSTPSLPVSKDDMPSQHDIDKWPYLKDVHIPNLDAEVGLLIGNDNPKLLEPQQIIHSKNGGPYATRTQLGWLINGPLGQGDGREQHKSYLIKSDANLESMFKMYCEIEFVDRKADQPEFSQQDKKALLMMEETVTLVDNHYQLGLPWTDIPPKLENNRPAVEHRLRLLKRRLQKDDNLHLKYSKFMSNLLEQGHAEPVPSAELDRDDGCVWYLPHHPVVNPKKPEKLRVVFDCSARYHGYSLNDRLLQGPDMTNNLVGVLLRFRLGKIAMVADVEGMFHQVRVQPDHRDALRFLWWPEGRLDLPPEEHRMNVHLFGATSSPSCANFALQKTARDHTGEFEADIVDSVTNNFYVDDFLRAVDTVAEAERISKSLCALLSLGGFRLTKWTSNSADLLKIIPESEKTTTARELDLQQPAVERVLGMEWDVQTDFFQFRIALKNQPPTRRGFLSLLSSVYDPLGLISPVILQGRIILQEMCSRQLAWDDEVPVELQKQMTNWTGSLKLLENFRIHRCVKADPGEYELHHFADASDVGYGAVSYLRITTVDGVVHTNMLMSKARVSPLKKLSIPRMELSAATVAIRLDKLIKKELQIPLKTSVFWTDSTTVLRYIENEDKRFKTFVANRLAVVHDNSTTDQWHYVNTKINPADQASRGQTVDKFLKNRTWLTGPDFLQLSTDQWPKRPAAMIQDSNPKDELEIKRPTKVATAVTSPELPTDRLMNYFSNWTNLLKCTAWILRYKNKLLERVRSNDPSKARRTEIQPITVEELDKAETALARYVQARHFASEIESLEKHGRVLKSSSIYKLDPKMSDELIRVGGRLKNASIPDDAKHQIILPANSNVANLLINHFHMKSAHSGRNHVLSLLRQKYWVIKANSTVRKTLKHCIDCRRNHGPRGAQKMSDLPADRVLVGKPVFSNVGVDYFGPIEIKRGRSTVKRYGCIFTCLAVRAVHIEIAHSLDTTSFISALRRFISRRGEPEMIRSDNGTNFVGGERELREAIEQWNQLQIHDFLLQKNIKWLFNPPLASHHGGVWERCIRTTRRIFANLLGNQKVDDEGLCTLMCETESIINSRPLTSISDDADDLSALTPNHLLLLRSGTSFPPGIFQKEDRYSRRRWRQVQYLSDQFWKRWVHEYLPILQTRQKWLAEQPNYRNGDLVLVVDEHTPRHAWPLGIVIETYPGDDGLVRQVLVRTTRGQYRRDIRKLCLLENSGAE